MTQKIFEKKYDTNQWESVSALRQDLSEIIFDTEEQGQHIRMACTELLENACKYAEVGDAQMEIYSDADNMRIEIIIQNITNPVQLEHFRNIYEEVTDDCPEAAYQKMALKSLDGEDSQLGLARIRYELDSNIEYEVKNDVEKLLTDGVHALKSNDLVILKVILKIPMVVMNK